jgi:hypothetical protein
VKVWSRARPDQVPLADRWRETIDRLGGFIPLLTIALTAFAVFIRGQRFVLFIIL